MTTITTGEVLNAQVRVRNNGDTEAKYSIVADVTVNKVADMYGGDNGNGRIQNGSVSEDDGQTVATFTKYSNLSINYNVSDAEKQTEILSAVQAYCEGVGVFAKDVVLAAAVATEQEEAGV